MQTHLHLWDNLPLPWLPANSTVQGIFGDSKRTIIHLCRRGKQRHGAPVGRSFDPGTPQDTPHSRPTLRGHAGILGGGDTKRFAFFVGWRCRTITIKDVAEETRLDWKTIKALDEQ